MAFRFGPKSTTDGLVSYLDVINPNSYPGSGNTLYDLTINGNNGSLVNGPVYNSTYGGNITCDGVNDYIQPTNITLTSFSLSIIYMPLVFDTDPSGPGRYNCVLETDGGGVGNMLIRYDSASGNSILIGNHDGGAGGYVYLNPSPAQTVNKVYEITVTYNDTTKLVSGYIGGVFMNSSTLTTNLKYAGTIQLGYTFNTRIFNYKVYNRVLSSSEILQNYNALKYRFGL
jgi:hypothetical protein